MYLFTKAMIHVYSRLEFHANATYTFISAFMMQIFFIYLDKFLTKPCLSRENTGHKNTPFPISLCPGINVQYFSNIFIVLGAINVRFSLKYKTIATYHLYILLATGFQNLDKLNTRLCDVLFKYETWTRES